MEFKQKAAELLKKPFLSFGWTPDYENIGIYYQRAANQFANTDITESIECYNLATDYLLKGGIIFEAAKCQELLGKLLKRNNKWETSVVAYEKAGELFRQLTQNDTASDMFSSAAQVAEQLKDIKSASTLYIKAVDVLVDNDKGVLSHDIFKKSTGFFLKNSLYTDAIELYIKQIKVLAAYKKPGIYKLQLSIFLIHLHQDASIASDYLNTCISDLGGSAASMALLGGSTVELPSELQSAQSILSAYQANDSKSLSSAVKNVLMFLDVEVAKLATQLTVKTPQQPAPIHYDIQEESFL